MERQEEEYIRPRSSFFGQLLTMLRRNLLLKRKSIKMTIAELLIPMLFLMQFVLLGVLSKSLNTTYPEISEFVDEPFPYFGYGDVYPMYPVLYAPSNNDTSAFLQKMATLWTQMSPYKATIFPIPFPSEAALEQAWLNFSSSSPRFLIGVGLIFKDAQLNKLDYALRFPPNLVSATSKPYFRTNDVCRPLKKNTSNSEPVKPDNCSTNAYARIGFSSLQNVISTAYMQLKNVNISLNFSSKMMPEPSVEGNVGGDFVATMPANHLANLLAFYVVFLVIFVVTEKEKKLIESMKIMGLRPAVYWLSWIILYGMIMLIVSLIALTLAKVLGIWPRSNFVLLLIDCLLYGASMIALGFCITPFFRRPLIAGLVTYALTQVFGFLYLVETFVPGMTDAGRWGLAVISPTAFFMSMTRVAKAEASGYGIGFGNAWSSSGFSFGHAVVMLAVDTIVYALLAIYFENVFPSDDTPKQRPWFFLLPSYWFHSKGPMASHSASMMHLFESGDIEVVPEEVRARAGIAINNLRKVFHGKTETIAVKDFTYEVYEDEILGILGHNGAGKTTLINMLCGAMAPTSGNAFVYGKDITDPEQLKEARTMIGICPQQNVLFDTFTVREHIEFYARLKGFSNSSAKKEFERIVDEIGMRTHADVQAQNLSGGQKRRLSIAIAVVGNPKVLILDEPTSGVDPFSRRFLWDMVREFRKGRCIMITTQSMQEADVFADRKLIISHGRLRCAGTSLFLKNRFGLGYHLTMAIKRDIDDTPITDFVTTFIPVAEKIRSHAGELCYVLPKSELLSFPTLFRNLDNRLVDLGIDSYGVSLTTMEEIFLRLADNDTDDPAQLESFTMKTILNKTRTSRQPSSTFAPSVKGSVSGFTKFWALFKIRTLLLFRSKLSFIFQFFIPFLLMIMNGVLANLANDWMSELFGTESLQIDELKDAFASTNTKLFFQNETGSSLDNLLSGMTILGNSLEVGSYENLLNSTSHYAGFRFDSQSAEKIDAVLVYNASALHAVPYMTNLILNAVFQWHTGTNESFRVANHPLPSNTSSPFQMGTFMFGSMLISMALSMIPGVYGMDVCRDRQLKIRSQIRMTGCSMMIYWSSAFAVHFLQFSASFAMMVALLYAFDVSSITDAIGSIVLLFSLHGPAMILFCYCASFLFTKAETAALGLPFPLAVLGFLLYMVVILLDAFSVGVVTKVLHYMFAFLFPFYGFYGAMIFVQEISLNNTIAKVIGQEPMSYFDWDSNIPIIFVAHSIQIPLLVLLIIYLECRFFNQSWLQFFGYHPKQKPDCGFVDVSSLDQQDDDVLKERDLAKRISPSDGSAYAILLRGLWKDFTDGMFSRLCLKCTGRSNKIETKTAVKNISMVFPKGEIFGLLGPNGAGKTTTLSMVTGELTPTMGDIFINGFSMQTETVMALQTMGSCPQSDTIWEDMTMREHLELFATLNDLPKARMEEAIQMFTKGLCITEHLDKKASELSGGTKRKLTFVISMIGNPPLVLLDEPSTGMDPQSKRYLWDMIMQSFTGQRGAVLTTHSMEEADALSDRIGIIVKGELRCVGSSQHLKNKFGSGYVMELKVSSKTGERPGDGVEQVKQEIHRTFPAAICTEEVYNRLVFAIPRTEIGSLGHVFAELDRIKLKMDLEEYSFSQTTIEQVFLHFAKLQEVPEEHPTGTLSESCSTHSQTVLA